ncbi:helicase/relaxase domain-containing protein [Vibrio tubiashii]|uniref:MobH family relaxase n=1 Tax=Vibrio tubiashii TaxID=29498 RepID=UPI001EFE35A4|nr:MobH family relaxase [Vibrio tubiashii]MCG9576651.1 helicase/relaxase domain-containing protein [Vibrio tubiashii]
MSKIKKALAKWLSDGDSAKQKQVSPFVVKPTDELLSKHLKFIDEIKGCTAVPAIIWNEIYMGIIQNVARFVQNLPASGAHHHSQVGGLLEHSLEIAMYAGRVTRGITFTTNGQERQVSELQQVFRFAVISAALLHDVGKLITDLRVVYKGDTGDVIWNPVLGPLPMGVPYDFSMKRDSLRSAQDHVHATLLLAKMIVPSKGFRWLSEQDSNLYRMWISTLSGNGRDFGGEIFDCIRRADRESAEMSLKNRNDNPRAIEIAKSKQPTSTVAEHAPIPVSGERYFHEPFIDYWKDQIHTNSVSLNSAGSYAWITDKYVFLISPKAITKATEYLKSINLSSLPTKMTDGQVMSKLLEHNAVVPMDPEKSTHAATKIKVFIPSIGDKKQWSHVLGLTAIRRELIDPEMELPIFKGTLTLDSQKSPFYDGINVAKVAEPKTTTNDQTAPPIEDANDKPLAQSAQTSQTPPMDSSSIDNGGIQSIVAQELSDLPGTTQPSNVALNKTLDYAVPFDEIEPLANGVDFGESSMGEPDESYLEYYSEAPAVQEQNTDSYQVPVSELSPSITRLEPNRTSDDNAGGESVAQTSTSARDQISNLLAPKSVKEEIEDITPQTDAELSGTVGTGRHFWEWLVSQSASKSFEMNKADAPVHVIMSNGAAVAILASPVTFMNYLRAHNRSTEKTDIEDLQKSFFKLYLHTTSTSGNFRRFTINKSKKRAPKRPLTAVVLTQEATKELFGDQKLSLNNWINF